MRFTLDHLTGFLVGLGASALAIYLYTRNRSEIDAFLRKQGIELPGGEGKQPSSMNLEELVAHKEHFEDLIAEREMSATAKAPAS